MGVTSLFERRPQSPNWLVGPWRHLLHYIVRDIIPAVAQHPQKEGPLIRDWRNANAPSHKSRATPIGLLRRRRPWPVGVAIRPGEVHLYHD